MTEIRGKADRKYIVTVQGKEIDLRETTVEQRLELVSRLTIEEWAKKGIDITNLPMRKDVERLIRLGDKNTLR
jgi:hypothetical protein